MKINEMLNANQYENTWNNEFSKNDSMNEIGAKTKTKNLCTVE